MSLTLGFDFRLLAFSGFGDPGLFPVKVLALDLRIHDSLPVMTLPSNPGSVSRCSRMSLHTLHARFGHRLTASAPSSRKSSAYLKIW